MGAVFAGVSEEVVTAAREQLARGDVRTDRSSGG
jgi:hypothetical protein